MAFSTLVVESTPPIATVTLNRPAEGNAINERMASELREALEGLSQDDAVGVVILTGSGGAFCTGTDRASLVVAAGAPQVLSRLRAAQSVAAMEKPVIAAIDGDALDQGLEAALACDLRIASGRARFGLTQAKDGLMPWDGGTQRLPRIIGRSRALEMLLTSRIVDASEALEMGLVNDVTEPGRVMERAREVASAIAGHGPVAARYLKETVLKGLDMPLEQGLRLEADLNFILQSTADRAEGIASFLQRRKPEYRGE